MYLEVTNLKKSYGTGEGRQEILKGVSLTMEQGATASIIGSSGCGKSTLLNCIGALDSATAKETLILLEKINADFGTTILMVTHNQVIPQMMRQNFTMKDGMIIENRVNEHPVPAGELEGL